MTTQDIQECVIAASKSLAKGHGAKPDLFEHAHEILAEVRLVRAANGQLFRYALDRWALFTDHDLDGLILEKTGWSISAIRAELGKLIGANVHVEGLDAREPCWLARPESKHASERPPVRERPPVAEFLALANGLLHIPNRSLWRPTSDFFSTSRADYAWSDEPGEPKRWLAFLDSLWADDRDSIALLQEFFGYVISGRNDLQKAALIVGPPRSGKGTIARVLSLLIGESRVVGLTLAAFGERFGQAPLVGGRLAILGDVRVSSRADQTIGTERLLSITGEDMQTIDAKYSRVPWQGRLKTILLLLSNEMPRFADASGALAGRLVVLSLTETFLGREDLGLIDALTGELPAILAWSLAGLDRLAERGGFTETPTGREIVVEIARLGSPVTAFVGERCELGPDLESPKAALYLAYRTWCEASGLKPTSMPYFARDLMAAFPHVKSVRLRGGGTTAHVYSGLALRAP